jgi:DtxR family Mn-dependent transcriptional regulator
LDKQKIALGAPIELLEIEPFDHSIRIRINEQELVLSQKIADNLYVLKHA